MRFFIFSLIVFTTNFSFSQEKILRNEIIESEGKFGIKPIMKKSDETIIQFDSIPIPLGGQYFNYYCVKKNGMWGVVFVSRYSVIEVIPYQYNNIKSIRNDFRFELPFLYNCHTTNRQDRGLDFMYLSTENQLLRLNSYNHKKDTIIVFTPKIDGNEVVLDKEHEFLFAPAWKYRVVAKIEKENIQKVIKYFRINAEGKDVNFWSSIDEKTCIEPDKRRAKSLLIYEEMYDSLSFIHEFSELENVSYNIVLDDGGCEHCFFWSGLRMARLHYILKTTQLESKKYKHEFLDFNGENIYTVVSKHNIDLWLYKKNKTVTYFYGNEKRICRFNHKKEKFYK